MSAPEDYSMSQEPVRRISTREIVLIVSLLVILGFAVYPLLKRDKTAASSAIALNNLVQWGIGLNLYLIDHDNRLPSVGPTQADPELKEAWYNALPPYLSQVPYAKISSPSFDRNDMSAIIWSGPALEKMFGKMKQVFIFPYAMNRYLQPVADQPAYAVYDLQSPRSVVFLSESASTDPGLLPGAVSYRYDRKMEAPTARAHVLFVDGHAAQTTRAVLSQEPAVAVGEPMPAISWLPFPGAPAPVVE